MFPHQGFLYEKGVRRRDMLCSTCITYKWLEAPVSCLTCNKQSTVQERTTTTTNYDFDEKRNETHTHFQPQNGNQSFAVQNNNRKKYIYNVLWRPLIVRSCLLLIKKKREEEQRCTGQWSRHWSSLLYFICSYGTVVVYFTRQRARITHAMALYI